MILRQVLGELESVVLVVALGDRIGGWNLIMEVDPQVFVRRLFDDRLSLSMESHASL